MQSLWFFPSKKKLEPWPKFFAYLRYVFCKSSCRKRDTTSAAKWQSSHHGCSPQMSSSLWPISDDNFKIVTSQTLAVTLLFLCSYSILWYWPFGKRKWWGIAESSNSKWAGFYINCLSKSVVQFHQSFFTCKKYLYLFFLKKFCPISLGRHSGSAVMTLGWLARKLTGSRPKHYVTGWAPVFTSAPANSCVLMMFRFKHVNNIPFYCT